MNMSIRLQFALCLLCLIFASCAFAQNTIKVLGSAGVPVVPDKLTFNVMLRDKGPQVSKLYAQVNQNTNLVVSYLQKESIDDKDIQSMAIQVQPWFEYEAQRRVQKGFELSRTIVVTLEDTKRLGLLLDYLFRIGNLEIGNVNLLVSEKEAHYRSALSLAIDSAKAKAKLLADELEVKLGKAVSVSELSTHSYGQPESLMKTQAMDASSGFLPGLVNISASVEVKFLIQ